KTLEALGHTQLRQRRTDADNGHRSWRRARTISQRPCWSVSMTFREIAETVLAASTSDETEVVCIRQDESLTRFANNHIHQNVTETNYEITVRCVAGTRVATAVSNDIRVESLRTLALRAGELANLQ